MEFVSSPYLLVFGDDRVRGTREQMILQVDLVRPRDGVGLCDLISFYSKKGLKVEQTNLWATGENAFELNLP